MGSSNGMEERTIQQRRWMQRSRQCNSIWERGLCIPLVNYSPPPHNKLSLPAHVLTLLPTLTPVLHTRDGPRGCGPPSLPLHTVTVLYMTVHLKTRRIFNIMLILKRVVEVPSKNLDLFENWSSISLSFKFIYGLFRRRRMERFWFA